VCCNWSCCVWAYGCVCESVTTITRNCVHCTDLHHIGSVGECSDYLQMIKFWPSRAPWKGVCGGANFFGSALLQPACSVCVSSERFFSFCFVFYSVNSAVRYYYK